MKLPIVCMECVKAEAGASPSNVATVEFRDDGRYETTCLKGHVSIVVLQAQKFEVLFDIGAYAIRDGYYREAVTSFHASLERFYEFFIKVVLPDKGGDEKVLQRSLKLANLSERQLGGFIFLYTNEFGNSPTLLQDRRIGSKDAVNFRNAVVHQGKIPSAQEARQYGQIILDLIRPLLQDIKQKYPNGLQATIFSHLNEGRGDTKGMVGTMSVPTIISLVDRGDDWNKRSLEKAIQELPRWQDILPKGENQNFQTAVE